jgi:lipoprotein-releasing system permease protein
MSLLRFAFQSLARNWRKTLALSALLAFCVLTFSSTLFLTDALEAHAAHQLDAAPDLVLSQLKGGRPSTIAVDAASKLTGRPGVAAISPRVWGYMYNAFLKSNILVLGREDPPAESSVLPGQAALGRALAEALGVQLGDSVAFAGGGASPLRLKVVKIAPESADLWIADALICHPSDARHLLRYAADEATDLAVSLSNRSELGVVEHELAEVVPGARVLNKDTMRRGLSVVYGRRSGLFLLGALPALLAALLLAVERIAAVGAAARREIGVLRSVGWSIQDVLWLKVFESLLIASAGLSVGLAAAYVWIFPLHARGVFALFGGSMPIAPTLHLVPQVDAAQLLGIALGTLGPFLASSAFAAFRAASIDPASALRD